MIKKGDKVKHTGDGDYGKVISVQDDRIHVEWEDGEEETWDRISAEDEWEVVDD